jgi:hypothetical protein
MQSRRKILKRGVLNSATPLSQALPGAQFAEWHAKSLTGTPEQVWTVLHELRARDLRISLPLFWARGLGLWTDSGRRMMEQPGPMAPVQEDEPRVSSSGMIAQPWKLRPRFGPAVENLDALRAFTESGWIKFGMEWVLSPLPGGRTYLETTTLCEATDPVARRRFAVYWLGIRAFSGLIRRDMLAAVQRRLSES